MNSSDYSARPAKPNLCLRPGEVVRDDDAHRGIACKRGRVWITQTGLARDVILSAGQAFQPRSAGLLVIEALETSCLERGETPAAIARATVDAL